MYAYPPSFPQEEVMYFLPLLRGQVPTDRALTVQAGWVILGFVLKQEFPVSDVPTVQLSHVEIADHLEAIASPHFSDPKSINWGQLLQSLLPVILQVLQNLPQKPVPTK